MDISSSLSENEKKLKDLFSDCYDLIIRKIRLRNNSTETVLITYFDTLINKELVFDNIFAPLTSTDKILLGNSGISFIKNSLLQTGNITDIQTFEDIIDHLTKGNVIILYQSAKCGLSINLPGWQTRSPDQPQTEVVVIGPKEGFIETLDINIGLLRRRFATQNLKTELMKIGKTGKNRIALVYLKEAVNEKLLAHVKDRLKKLDINLILDSSHIEHLIEDRFFSPFPQLIATERPDLVTIGITQGRVAIMMDGSPHVLLVPGLFLDFLHSIEDYYHRFYYSLAIRFIRYLMYGIGLLFPALYIAITTYHQEMIPTPLLITITSSRTGVPFPAVVEALLMEITFEALREASLRLPKAIGPAITIVGALVIGEAAVTAGIISQPMVIVVALTGIASFTTPGYSAAISERLLRFPIMIMAASFGLFGILLSLLAIIIHLAGLKTFGIPYLSSITPLAKNTIPDFLRIPLPYQNVLRRKKYESKNNKKGYH